MPAPTHFCHPVNGESQRLGRQSATGHGRRSVVGARCDAAVGTGRRTRLAHGATRDSRATYWVSSCAAANTTRRSGSGCARWRGAYGVVERSSNGQNYERLWTFQDADMLAGPTSHLLVGKVPFHGEPEDYEEAGPVGNCQIDLVEVYSE